MKMMTKNSKLAYLILLAGVSVAVVGTARGAFSESVEPSPHEDASVSLAEDIVIDPAVGSPIYQLKANALDGHEISLGDYKGKVLLIVNTASHCGFTPQYAGLQALSKKYDAQGLKVLGFPCDQFGHQEPGDAADISSFCTKNYGVDFQMFDKIEVNGKNANPLYVFLKKGTKDHGNIRWNFTKFLVDKEGRVIKRYGSMASPDSLATDIEAALK
ncbi:hypothetical protein BH11CYA1_BH11CYA1_12890 [soil metagenome]